MRFRRRGRKRFSRSRRRRSFRGGGRTRLLRIGYRM